MLRVVRYPDSDLVKTFHEKLTLKVNVKIIEDVDR